jgi:hypothetical protein
VQPRAVWQPLSLTTWQLWPILHIGRLTLSHRVSASKPTGQQVTAAAALAAGPAAAAAASKRDSDRPCHGGRDSFELKWHAIGVIIQWLAAVHSQAASPVYSEAVTWLCFTRDLNFNG